MSNPKAVPADRFFCGHGPGIFASQVFVSLLLSPEGIVGDYPIAYENIEITSNNGIDAVAEIKDDKFMAAVVSDTVNGKKEPFGRK